MLDKLSAINDRYDEVEKLISSPDAMNDMKLYVQLSKEYKDLEPIVSAYKEYRDLVGNISEAKEILSNSVMSISSTLYNKLDVARYFQISLFVFFLGSKINSGLVL